MEKKVILKTKGMHCTSCEKLIQGAVKDIRGVKDVRSDYSMEKTEIVFDDSETDVGVIKAAIEKEGYRTEELPEPSANDKKAGNASSFNFGTAALALGIIAILAGLYLFLGKNFSFNFSSINENTSIIILLLIGFLTGFHCIGMCGGFVLAYAGKIKKQGDILPHLQYGAGKTVSYTVIGAVFGLLGSVIAFTPALRGSVAIIAGIFLVLYGLNMLNVFSFLRRFQPRLPSLMPNWEWGGKGPLVTGLLNGLMLACGPLMALYIFAAGTGSPIAGAKALFFFGLGTLAPLLTFGWLSHYLSSALTSNVVRFSGVMVVVLGLLMASNGMALLGIGTPSLPAIAITKESQVNDTASNIKLDKDGYQVIDMNVTASGWQPSSFTLRKGIPVKWQINVLELTGCNNEITVPDYNLDIKLKPGLQTVEFTPAKEGLVRWSCWMGMIRGQFYIVNDTSSSTAPPPPPPSGGGCGCGGRR